MKKSLSIVIALAPLVGVAVDAAEVTVYGRANMSLESVEEGDVSTTELVSNSSRIGFKGGEKINDDLEVIYQLEYEAYFDDGDTFKQRNIFVGVRGEFGQLIGGHIDTPFKTVQNKIELFDNLRGDLKHIVSPHENRTSNTIEYTTPDTLNGLKAEIALINSEIDGVDDGKSIAVSWGDDHFYIGGAFDQDVEFAGIDAMRVAAQYNRGSWQFGALYEETDAEFLDESIAAYMASVRYKLEQNWVLKVQHGASDAYLGFVEDSDVPTVIFEDATTTSVGADYVLTTTTKLFGFYTAEDFTVAGDDIDNRYVGIGMEHRF